MPVKPRSRLEASAHPVDDSLERDPVLGEDVGVALDVHHVSQRGVERLDRLVADTGATQYREHLALVADLGLIRHAAGRTRSELRFSSSPGAPERDPAERDRKAMATTRVQTVAFNGVGRA